MRDGIEDIKDLMTLLKAAEQVTVLSEEVKGILYMLKEASESAPKEMQVTEDVRILFSVVMTVLTRLFKKNRIQITRRIDGDNPK